MLENEYYGGYAGIYAGNHTSIVASTCSDGTGSIQKELISESCAIRNSKDTSSKEE